MSPLFLQSNVPERSPTVFQFLEQNGAILLATALGLLAVCLLLPRARRYPALAGGVLGVVALVLAGWWLIQPEPIWVETLLFYVFAGLAVLFGGIMVTQTHPVRAALSFAMVVLSTCGLFLLQAAPFLMAATIIIYAGAIVVTFLFVIMLAQQSGLDNADHRSREPVLACVAGFILLAAILCVLARDFGPRPQHAELVARLAEYQSKMTAALKAPDVNSLKKAVADASWLKQFQEALKPLENPPAKARNYKNDLVDWLTNAEETWLDVADGGEFAETARHTFQKQMKEAYVLTWRLQNELRGTLVPPPAAPLSPFSGASPNQPPPLDKQGRPSMPADNVAALGRSLFTDYLVAVELAATLLLVATIGAIVIAGRKTGGLR